MAVRIGSRAARRAGWVAPLGTRRPGAGQGLAPHAFTRNAGLSAGWSRNHVDDEQWKHGGVVGDVWKIATLDGEGQADDETRYGNGARGEGNRPPVCGERVTEAAPHISATPITTSAIPAPVGL